LLVSVTVCLPAFIHGRHGPGNLSDWHLRQSSWKISHQLSAKGQITGVTRQHHCHMCLGNEHTNWQSSIKTGSRATVEANQTKCAIVRCNQRRKEVTSSWRDGVRSIRERGDCAWETTTGKSGDARGICVDWANISADAEGTWELMERGGEWISATTRDDAKLLLSKTDVFPAEVGDAGTWLDTEG